MSDIINCQYCGQPRPKKLQTCPYCKPTTNQVIKNGIDKAAGKIAQTAENIKSAHAQKKHLLDTTTKKCIKCAMDVPTKAEICPYCNTRLKTSQTTMGCAVMIVLLVLTAIFSDNTDRPQPAVATPRQISKVYVSCNNKYDQIITYSALIGRGAACGENISGPMESVGGWIDSCFDSSERGNQLHLFTIGVEYAANQQKNGQSPDSCYKVSSGFQAVAWPNNKP